MQGKQSGAEAAALLARIDTVQHWLERFLLNDELLGLRLYALLEHDKPELAEITDLLDRVELLLGVHLARLQGADVIVLEGEYLVLPLPEM